MRLLLFALWALPLCSLVPTTRAASDVAVSWVRNQDFTYNPSLVEHGDKYVSALKRTTFRKVGRKTFWINHLYMCVGQRDDLHSLRCNAFNPWSEPYLECEFGSNVRNGKTDVTGLGDVKVWAWPGKGVYAIFGRKPERTPGSGQYCNTKVVYDQWIAQVRPEPGAGPWRLQQPLRLHLSGGGYTYPDEPAVVMEKNWMPWVHRGKDGIEMLHVTHMVNPHRVLEVSPSGACTVRHETQGTKELFARFAEHPVHGGPPVIRVEAARSGDGQPYYLGVMHHIEWLTRMSGTKERKIKLYRHFAYKFQPEPPFAVTAVSDELRLTFYSNRQHPTKAYIAYVSGFYMADNGTVYMSYGAGDREARVMVLPLAELEASFTGRIEFLQHEGVPTA
ncbi:hypothetical protein TSOC_008273 [Tetrabaena socialis]|uniref:Uncharacterized protein n=1 Tax=Tetrabaena socialis TaxID=47790 RepID=A0A2J7ZYU1_9CHLO|nr:hypothetical protein TSOC_008273 [Tetrabaena socialis]|eukprot:PNH05439.1 hypothetical protein TSOC_008273 [Tetrabaena socialis]